MVAPKGENDMKSKKIAAFAAVAAIVLLAACGAAADQNVNSGEMAAPEVSSQDLLVSSLEYLLLDNGEEDTADNEQDTPDEEEDTSGWKEYASDGENDTPDEERDLSVEEVQNVQAVIYFGDGGSVALKQETAEVEELTPDELISVLSRHNIVSLDTKVLSFEQEEKDGAVILHLDLSKAAGEYLRTMSKEAECIIVAAIVDTFVENYNADAVCITVEGEVLVTSHAEYTEPIVQCTPKELLERLETYDADEPQSKLPAIKEKK